ncbi:LysE family translocator [Pseudomonas mandelii]|uniref:LysE family translocator n=1 Tax=Pseudomonas mandelii TaxID=75612 RepID=A0A502IEH9_9PSED|nr:LysE family translocator [Pseudomonas mandelii]TPG84795.1 LysE family translocator [Pseudomonas mandelii]
MEDLALYLLALSMIFLMPGPDMILLLQTGAKQGRSFAMATALGLALARACHVTLTALGLATIFKVLPWTFDVVKYAGAAYLLWIGLQMFKSSGASSPTAVENPVASPSLKAAFQRGLLTNLLNPKALLFSSILLPQFIDPHRSSVWEQFAVLGIVLVITGLVFDSIFATASAWVGRWLERSALAQRIQQWLFGTLLIGFSVRLALVQQA